MIEMTDCHQQTPKENSSFAKWHSHSAQYGCQWMGLQFWDC